MGGILNCLRNRFFTQGTAPAPPQPQPQPPNQPADNVSIEMPIIRILQSSERREAETFRLPGQPDEEVSDYCKPPNFERVQVKQPELSHQPATNVIMRESRFFYETPQPEGAEAIQSESPYQPTETVTIERRALYEMQGPEGAQPQTSNQPTKSLTYDRSVLYEIREPEGAQPQTSNQPTEGVTIERRVLYEMQGPEGSEPQTSDQPIENLTIDKNVFYSVQESEGAQPQTSNQPAQSATIEIPGGSGPQSSERGHAIQSRSPYQSDDSAIVERRFRRQLPLILCTTIDSLPSDTSSAPSPGNSD